MAGRKLKSKSRNKGAGQVLNDQKSKSKGDCATWALTAAGLVALLATAIGIRNSTSSQTKCTVTVLDPSGIVIGTRDVAELGAQHKYYDIDGLQVQPQHSCSAPNRTVYEFPKRDGKHFVWPPGYVGKRVKVKGVDGRKTIELETLSIRPKVFRVHNFISEDEAEGLIKRATDPSNPYRLRRSTTGTEDWNKKGASEIASTRTSENAFDISSEISRRIFKRAFQLLRVPFRMCQADGIQILRYDKKQAYDDHHDYFAKGVKVQTGTFDFDSENGGSNRFATLFLYLNDVDQGGQTVFPLADPSLNPSNGSMPEEYLDQFDAKSWEVRMVKKCFEKFSVKPRKYSAILFYSQDAEGRLDSRSLHGGCPVLSGLKWAANVWVWNKCRYGT